MIYGDFKDLARRTAYDKVLRDRAFNIAKNPKYDRYQRRLASMVYKFFDKMTAGSGKFNKGFRFLFCVDDIFSIYAWVVPLKNKIGITITILFRKCLKNLIENLIKYELTKEANFTIVLLKMVKR